MHLEREKKPFQEKREEMISREKKDKMKGDGLESEE